MATDLPDNTDAELDAFDDICRRLAGFGDRVHPEWADGYLTAIAAGPRAVETDEWLPRMCGDAFARAFADPQDEQRARSALEARMRVLRLQLDPEALDLDPDALRLAPRVHEWTDEERAALASEHGLNAEEAASLVTGALWAQGFIDAIGDFDADWAAAQGDAEAQEGLLAHVAALLLPEASPELEAFVARHYRDQAPTRDDLLDEACFAIQDLRLWWLDHAPAVAPRRVEPRPGRNDPCPCGSGLKFKRCHGRAA